MLYSYLKYVEKIMTMLSKNGLIERVHGKDGDYRLYRALDDYKTGDILLVAEGCSPMFPARKTVQRLAAESANAKHCRYGRSSIA